MKNIITPSLKSSLKFLLRIMTSHTTHKLIAGAILLVVLIVVFDTFILPGKKIIEIKDNGTISSSRTSVSRSYLSYFIITKSKHKYLVPKNIYGSLIIGKPFTIYQSFIFRKPIQLSWCEEDNHCYIQNIGTMNGNYLSYIVIGYLVVWPLLVLMNVINATTRRNEVRQWFAVVLAAGTFAFYLWY